MRELFLKDWAWKLFSLFLAVAIWLTVHRILEPETASLAGITSTQIYENLAVHPVSSSMDVSLYHVVPPVVRVTVSGPADIMGQLQSSQIRAEVDLTGGAAGSGQINVVMPPDVTLDKVDPQTVLIIPPPKH
jgi:YbbR domain-containing protein